MATESHLRRVRPAIGEMTLMGLGHWAVGMLSALGTEVLQELGRFSREAGPGSMITIRRTRGGFTAQVTGAIVAGHRALTPESIREMTLGVD